MTPIPFFIEKTLDMVKKNEANKTINLVEFKKFNHFEYINFPDGVQHGDTKGTHTRGL